MPENQLYPLNASVLPQARPEVCKLERTDQTELLTSLHHEISPQLATTAAWLWISHHLPAVIKLPNPRYAAAAGKEMANG